MNYSSLKKSAVKSLQEKNWEQDIDQVCIEPCDFKQDPMGYCAVFYQKRKTGMTGFAKSFVIGASFLSQRESSLSKVGYSAPMTNKAIAMIERKTGFSLSSLSMPVAA